MTDKILSWVRLHEKSVLALLVVIFISIRLIGVNLPLHQDEYKWPIAVNPAQSKVIIPHPPVGELIYRTAGYVVGFNVHFRYVPIFFGTLNLLLLYYFMRSFFGRRHAVVASLIWVFSYFSVLASLMVDTDGQIMPFFFLLALIGYFKVRSESVHDKKRWGILLVLACILGFLVKVSFILAIGAIVADFLWSKRYLISKKYLVRYGIYGLSGLVVLGLLLFVMKFLFPFFRLSTSVTYWEHFAVLHRNWFQTGIQCVKALLYSSPLLVLVPLLGLHKGFAYDTRRTKVFMFFILFAFIFYVVFFDFSIGALDRYLQLLILPLTVLTTCIIVPIFQIPSVRTKQYLYLGCILGLVLILLQSLPHYVPPLHPKAEWVSRFLSLRWNFVYPFSGGSGPLGFYVSFLFIALSWIISVVALSVAWWMPRVKKLALIVFVMVGIAYNGVFIEEYLVGFWNGYAPTLLTNAVEFIRTNPDIQKVTVYNDNGGNEVQATGKYHRRLYVDPMFDIVGKVITLNTDKMHYLMLDVPRLDPHSVYQRYFDSCIVVYREVDKKMSATVFDCRNALDVKI